MSDKKTIGHVSHGPKQDEDEDIDAVIARLIDAQSSGERFKLISETEHAAALERVREEGRAYGLRQAARRARNCSHSCMSEEHCGFLHAAHKRLADELEEMARNTEGGGDAE